MEQRRELRCLSTLHGVMVSDHILEVKCRRRACGAANGVVVLHDIDVMTGKCETRKFADPIKKRRGE